MNALFSLNVMRNLDANGEAKLYVFKSKSYE